jgi:adenylosuccinate synthase
LARERATLILDCLKEQDPGRRRQALAVVHAVYGKGQDKWLEAVESALQGKAGADVQINQSNQELKNTTDEKLQALYRKKQELAFQLSAAYEDELQEFEGTAGTQVRGIGPVYRAKYERTQKLKEELEQANEEIEQYRKLHRVGTR